MSSRRPNIGVTGPDKGGTAAWWFSWFAIAIHGGRAIHIRPEDGIPDADIHGLIIGGGADINPKRYGESQIRELLSEDQKLSGIRQLLIRLATILFFPIIILLRKLFSTTSVGIDNARDEMELDLLDRAVEKGIPILGICRGAQLMNIYFGGTLHQDIENYYTEVPRPHSVWPKKKVQIDEQSKLFEVLTFQTVWVNAMHRQAVDETGDNMTVVAREERGIIQAIEHQYSNFVLGVQWHPEYMPQVPSQRRIFKRVVEEAQEFMLDQRKG
ncbi:gamma-glutamyl-gamma-aminobutyrate hydrolase family protein [Fodinibius halophilus]|uniref:Gamma-glutamyl-gamma-aminobutyrate hydrolase family protein n=1 Tax=Fodinibius halophilus TaxID=1736908 RepID=A0A6M1TD93_9BACT|nr:gamma-glutamyl-gamma-aminobutyrate hydrolase family protein [Fodinibius halophilus]NGP88142.1 gamma-glutamyl-gamma-aminobutyrate hydrolase family protein [Fodinibius halophilus]